MKSKIFISLIFMILSSFAKAEGGCPPGQYPANPPAVNICYPMPDSEDSNPTQSTVRWETRWGAIATDNLNGKLGASVRAKSKRIATKAAVAQCRLNGGTKCIVDIAYYNQCAVMVLGEKKYNTASAATLEEAKTIGMKACGLSNKNCRVYYSDCSPAERVR
ncbi:MAG TPA: DUF4189 domain-containing protein [Arenimonas sp.]|nr:DUF4189 domain-containing protein [Arenimonas sp.]HPW32046.1 DUF4189 domain-containing protein [Arenimonas sp.]